MRKTPHPGSAVHPAAKRPKKGTDNASVASSSDVPPAALGADLLEKVHKLGHYPRRFKKAETDEQKAENSLAKKIAEAWAELPEEAKQTLTALTKEGSIENEILKAVRQLGHFPQRLWNATTDEQRAENALADNISKRWAKLPEGAREELQQLRNKTLEELRELKAKAKDEHTAAKETELLERLRAFGRWPQDSRGNSDLQRKLAHDIRKSLQGGFLSRAAEAEIDEMHWMHLRELEAKALEDKAAAQEAWRQAARARKERLRTLLALLRTSQLRCDCHDFAHWYALWRCNPQLSTRLRLAGHHFRHCRLVRDAYQPAFGESADCEDESADSDDSDSAVKMFWPLSFVGHHAPDDSPDPVFMQKNSLAKERERESYALGREFDADSGNPSGELSASIHPYRGDATSKSSVFESAGLLADCAHCGSAIVCGVLHSGIPVDGAPAEADHHMVTFLHRCEDAQCKLDILARGWEDRMVPYERFHKLIVVTS
jgi:hypothetical protein